MTRDLIVTFAADTPDSDVTVRSIAVTDEHAVQIIGAGGVIDSFSFGGVAAISLEEIENEPTPEGGEGVVGYGEFASEQTDPGQGTSDPADGTAGVNTSGTASALLD